MVWGGAPAAIKQADTGAAGVALQNGTPTFLTWTAPNDGQLHQFSVTSFLNVTLAETGGQVTCDYTAPGAGATSFQVQPGGSTAGFNAASGTRLCTPGSTVTVVQSTALTAGTAQLWAQLWGV